MSGQVNRRRRFPSPTQESPVVRVELTLVAITFVSLFLLTPLAAVFIEALRTPEQMATACERFAGRVPLLANMVEGGQTPVSSAAALGELGFRIVIFPGGTVRALAHALQGYFASLAAHGSTAPWKDRMLDFDGLNGVIGTPELLARGRHYDST